MLHRHLLKKVRLTSENALKITCYKILNWKTLNNPSWRCSGKGAWSFKYWSSSKCAIVPKVLTDDKKTRRVSSSRNSQTFVRNKCSVIWNCHVSRVSAKFNTLVWVRINSEDLCDHWWLYQILLLLTPLIRLLDW